MEKEEDSSNIDIKNNPSNVLKLNSALETIKNDIIGNNLLFDTPFG